MGSLMICTSLPSLLLYKMTDLRIYVPFILLLWLLRKRPLLSFGPPWAFWHITTTFFQKRSINVLGLNKSLSTSFKWRIGRRSRASCTMRKKRWSILEHKTIDHHNKFSLENSFSQLTSIARKLKKKDCSAFTDLQLIPSCLQPSCSFEQFVSLFAALPHLALFTSRLWLIPFDVVTKPFIKRPSF